MKYYMAPMEGITGYIYRNAYNDIFHNIDKYFTPFITPNNSKSFKTKELRDILPENNKGVTIVPQILTNNSQAFIETAHKLAVLGYDEVNLNLGCPSGTVVAKGRGAGLLADTQKLDRLLYEIFEGLKDKLSISIKTRIGKDSSDEFPQILDIYNQYELKELIIHPRIQKDYYTNKPNYEVFSQALQASKNTVIYNGDITTSKEYKNILLQYPSLKSVMIGRGIIANPALIGMLRENESKCDKNTIKEFHDKVYDGYINMMSGDKNVLFKMKEIWVYLSKSFTNGEKYKKRITKAHSCIDYNSIVAELFSNEELTFQK